MYSKAAYVSIKIAEITEQRGIVGPARVQLIVSVMRTVTDIELQPRDNAATRNLHGYQRIVTCS
jgi:hypothetical protein